MSLTNVITPRGAVRRQNNWSYLPTVNNPSQSAPLELSRQPIISPELQFSVDEIRDQLASLGVRDLPTEHLFRLKQHLDELITQDATTSDGVVKPPVRTSIFTSDHQYDEDESERDDTITPVRSAHTRMGPTDRDASDSNTSWYQPGILKSVHEIPSQRDNCNRLQAIQPFSLPALPDITPHSRQTSKQQNLPLDTFPMPVHSIDLSEPLRLDSSSTRITPNNQHSATDDDDLGTSLNRAADYLEDVTGTEHLINVDRKSSTQPSQIIRPEQTIVHYQPIAVRRKSTAGSSQLTAGTSAITSTTTRVTSSWDSSSSLETQATSHVKSNLVTGQHHLTDGNMGLNRTRHLRMILPPRSPIPESTDSMTSSMGMSGLIASRNQTTSRLSPINRGRTTPKRSPTPTLTYRPALHLQRYDHSSGSLNTRRIRGYDETESKYWDPISPSNSRQQSQRHGKSLHDQSVRSRLSTSRLQTKDGRHQTADHLIKSARGRGDETRSSIDTHSTNSRMTTHRGVARFPDNPVDHVYDVPRSVRSAPPRTDNVRRIASQASMAGNSVRRTAPGIPQLRRHDPVARYQLYHQNWLTRLVPGEDARRLLRWNVKTAMMHREVPVLQRNFAEVSQLLGPSASAMVERHRQRHLKSLQLSYVPPTSRRHSELRWQIRTSMGLANPGYDSRPSHR